MSREPFSVTEECKQYFVSDANSDPSNQFFRDGLRQVMAYAVRDAGGAASQVRAASYMRLALATIGSGLAFWLLSAGLAQLATSLFFATAILNTVNDWGSRAHILRTFASDQALYLHDGQIHALSDSIDGLGYEVRKRRRPPRV